MRRPDETPTLDVTRNMLCGLTFALLLIVLGREIRAGDDNLAHFD
jgi:hypothetical protein